jgi:hypothetical protein
VYGHAFALLHPSLGGLLGVSYFLTLVAGSSTGTYARLSRRPVADLFSFLEILAVIRTLR